MTLGVQVAGKALIKVGTGSAGALEDLGYTRNGADVTKEAYWGEIHGDEHGGDEGPPIDIQFFGEIARIRLELTKYDPATLAKVESRIASGTAGTIAAGDIGALMIGGSKAMRLLIAAASGPVNFPIAIPRGAIELNKGTKFTTAVLEFEAHRHPTTGLLYDSTIT